MNPYYQDSWTTIYLGDCREILSSLSAASVNMVLTDPPWMVSSEVIIHRSMKPKKYKYVGRNIVLDFGEWDHFENEEQYWEFTASWFSEAVRTLRPGGHLITFFDQNRVTPLIELARSLGCTMRQQLYWLKSNPVPRARKVDFMVALEHACWFTKEPRQKATFNYQLGQQANYVTAPIPGHTTSENGDRCHPTQKPIKVISVWISYLSNEGDIILDPLMGSGSTLVAARRLGRKAIGIDISEKYCELARKRLEETPIPMKLTG